MRTRLPMLRWFGLPALVLAASLMQARSVASAPLEQTTLTITTAGFVDKFPISDPDCPGCNGVYDAEDRTEAGNNPLPSMEFVVRSGTGAELGRQTTQDFLGVQRAQFDVPEETSYTVELVADPSGWQLCPNNARTRTLTQADFRLGAATVRFDFTQGCGAAPPTSTPTPGPSPTLRPGVTPSATPEPGDRDDDDDDDDRDDEGQGPFGQIRGIAFIDYNESGKFEAGEPPLNDVKVNLGGGGLEVFQITEADGGFNFPGLGVGTYDVFIDPGAEWFVTTPRKLKVPVNGNDVAGINFGMIRHVDRGLRVARHDAAPRTGRRLVIPAGSGIRLPSTGFTEMPQAPLAALLVVVFGGLAAVGFAADRRSRRR